MCVHRTNLVMSNKAMLVVEVFQVPWQLFLVVGLDATFGFIGKVRAKHLLSLPFEVVHFLARILRRCYLCQIRLPFFLSDLLSSTQFFSFSGIETVFWFQLWFISLVWSRRGALGSRRCSRAGLGNSDSFRISITLSPASCRRWKRRLFRRSRLVVTSL